MCLPPRMDNTRPAAGIVKALRTLAGMSQRELAEKSGVAASTIGRIESGAMDPSLGDRLEAGAGAELGGRVVKTMTAEQLWGESAKLIPNPVMRTMCAHTTMVAADQVLERFRVGAGYQPGQAVHPGDPFGKVLAWQWLTDRAAAMLTLADFGAQLRDHGRDPAPVTLDDVLAGLTLAMPTRFPDAEFEALIAEARRTVAGMYGRPFRCGLWKARPVSDPSARLAISASTTEIPDDEAQQ